MPLQFTTFTWSRRQEWNNNGSATVHSGQSATRELSTPS